MLHDQMFLATDEIFVGMCIFAHPISLLYIETFLFFRTWGSLLSITWLVAMIWLWGMSPKTLSAKLCDLQWSGVFSIRFFSPAGTGYRQDEVAVGNKKNVWKWEPEERSKEKSLEIYLIATFQICWEAELFLREPQAKLLNYAISPQLKNSLIIQISTM